MISGIVSLYLQPLVSLEVAGRNDVRQSLRFTIDTGFAGELGLPPQLIQDLGLSYQGQELAFQVVGQTLVNSYAGSMFWHGEKRTVQVIETDGAVLLGTALLRGSKLTIGFHPGGAVLIEEE